MSFFAHFLTHTFYIHTYLDILMHICMRIKYFLAHIRLIFNAHEFALYSSPTYGIQFRIGRLKHKFLRGIATFQHIYIGGLL